MYRVKIEDIQSVKLVMERMREISNIGNQLSIQPNTIANSKPDFLKSLEKAQQNQAPKQIENVEEEVQPIQNILKTNLESPVEKNKPKQKPQDSTSTTNYLDRIIQKESKSKGLDPDLVKAIIKAESNFNPKAESPKGAMGLMQLMPDTADLLGVDDPFNPKENIKGGTSYLKDMLGKFKNVDHAIAAYNAGPGAVKKYGGIPPYSETKDYVRKVKAYYEDFKD
jgi:soluble lytic murein transglycosylase-like protein